MIKPADRSVFVDNGRGALEAFEPEALREELAACFRAAGRPEQTGFAEDIALAVECALLNTSVDGPVAETDLAALIVRVLGEIGLEPVADAYRRRRGETDTVAADPETLRTVLGDASSSRAVARALRNLGIVRARRELVRELARALPAEPAPIPNPAPFVPTPVVTPGELLAELPPEIARRFGMGIIRFSGINRVLPSIRFRCSLIRLADELELGEMPTELELAAPLAGLGSDLRGCFAAALRCFRRKIGELEAPDPRRYLFFSDMPEFITGRLGGSWPEAEPLARTLAELVGVGLGPGVVCKFR